MKANPIQWHRAARRVCALGCGAALLWGCAAGLKVTNNTPHQASAQLPCETRQGPLKPVLLAPAELPSRHGHGVTELTALETSRERPVEVCQSSGQLRFLQTLRCADGSSPFRNAAQAYRARVGSVGNGGRCDSVIDLYQVPCGEKVYEVYMDLYVCAMP